MEPEVCITIWNMAVTVRKAIMPLPFSFTRYLNWSIGNSMVLMGRAAMAIASTTGSPVITDSWRALAACCRTCVISLRA
ncbi:hypothetical protein D3C76_1731200 [compost metagenome]